MSSNFRHLRAARTGILPRCGCATRRGFSLVEATISTFIMGVLMVAALQTVDGVALTRRAVGRKCQGPALARQLMTEILQCYYTDPGAAPGNTSNRLPFLGVSDYNNYTESPPQARDGTVLTDYLGWSRHVSVALADPTNPANTAGSDLGLKRITVTVTDPKGNQTVLVGLRSKSGAGEYTPVAQTTTVTWTGVDLQVGGTPAAVRTGTQAVNQATAN